MKRKFAVPVRLTVALWAAALALAGPAGAATTGGTTASITADIPVGPSDADPATSRGLTAILDNCAAAYEQVRAMHSVGTYYSISKSSDDTTSHSQAMVVLNFTHPGKLAVRTTSDNPDLVAGFIADSKQVTMLSEETKTFIRMPQPDSLAAFTDPYRAGEIYTDKSGAVGMSVIGPMLVTDDAYAVLHEDITRYVYEGEESVGDVDCHRVRFVQDDPDVVVNLWISKDSWLIHKASFITSYDSDFKRVESFEAGAIARMLIMTVDEMTTDPTRVETKAFAAAIPKGYKEADSAEKAATDSGTQQKGFWESLVSLSAETSPEETTWSLTSDSNVVEMQLSKFAEVSATAQDFEKLRLPGSPEQVLAVGAKDGKITLHKADGSVSETIDLKQPLKMFSLLETQSCGPLLLTAGDSNSLQAHTLDGNRAWEYRHPFATISSIGTVPPDTTSTEEAVYVTLTGKDGLRKLGADGDVLFANGRLEYSGGLKPAPAGVDRLFSRGLYKITILDKSLDQVSAFETKEDLPSIRWDVEEKAYPIVAVAVSSDSDILLQRRAENGEIAWTTMIAPKAEDVASSALHWARVRVGDTVERCLAILLSDGQVVLASTDGKIIYRGQLSANAALVERNGGSVVQNMAVADLDSDGVDEIYTRMDNYVLRLATTP